MFSTQLKKNIEKNLCFHFNSLSKIVFISHFNAVADDITQTFPVLTQHLINKVTYIQHMRVYSMHIKQTPYVTIAEHGHNYYT